MSVKIEVTVENEVGVERTLKLPGRYEVCGRCEGTGKHVNPSVDGHGISAEEFAEDPDFKEAYFSGVYDVTCHDCKGLRVVPVLDEEAFNSPAKQKLLKRIHDAAQASAEVDAMYEMERRYGA